MKKKHPVSPTKACDNLTPPQSKACDNFLYFSFGRCGWVQSLCRAGWSDAWLDTGQLGLYTVHCSSTLYTEHYTVLYTVHCTRLTWEALKISRFFSDPWQCPRNSKKVSADNQVKFEVDRAQKVRIFIFWVPSKEKTTYSAMHCNVREIEHLKPKPNVTKGREGQCLPSGRKYPNIPGWGR